MRAANFFCFVSSSLMAFQALLIAWGAGLTVIRLIDAGDPNAAILPLVFGMLGVFLGMLFGIPRARDRFFRPGARWYGRIVMVVPVLLILLWMALGVGQFVAPHPPAFMDLLPYKTWGKIFIGSCLLLFCVFLLPGLYYFRYRAEPEGFNDPATATTQSAPTSSLRGFLTAGVRPVENEPLYSKVTRTVWTFTAVAVVGLLLYVLTRAQFLPDPGHVTWTAEHRGALIGASALVLGLLALVSKLPEVSDNYGPLKAKAPRKLIAVAAMVAISFAVPLVVERGAPALHSLVVDGNPDRLSVVVVERGRENRRRACDRTAVVAWNGAPGYARMICEVPAGIWAGLKSGDRLELSGRRTAYGLRYEEIRRGAARPEGFALVRE